VSHAFAVVELICEPISVPAAPSPARKTAWFDAACEAFDGVALWRRELVVVAHLHSVSATAHSGAKMLLDALHEGTVHNAYGRRGRSAPLLGDTPDIVRGLAIDVERAASTASEHVTFEFGEGLMVHRARPRSVTVPALPPNDVLADSAHPSRTGFVGAAVSAFRDQLADLVEGPASGWPLDVVVVRHQPIGIDADNVWESCRAVLTGAMGSRALWAPATPPLAGRRLTGFATLTEPHLATPTQFDLYPAG
jgi:hypothetical protein